MSCQTEEYERPDAVWLFLESHSGCDGHHPSQKLYAFCSVEGLAPKGVASLGEEFNIDVRWLFIQEFVLDKTFVQDKISRGNNCSDVTSVQGTLALETPRNTVQRLAGGKQTTRAQTKRWQRCCQPRQRDEAQENR